MRRAICFLLLLVFIIGCASNVKFVQTDEAYDPEPRPDDAEILFTEDQILRPHQVIGVIEVEEDKSARKPEIDALMKRKAREVGADGVMLVEYDIDREVYVEKHHSVVGRGPYRHHVVKRVPRTEVKKLATGIAIIFTE